MVIYQAWRVKILKLSRIRGGKSKSLKNCFALISPPSNLLRFVKIDHAKKNFRLGKRSRHASKTIINNEKQTDHFLKKNPCKFEIAFVLSRLSCRSKVFLRIISGDCKSTTRRCLDQKRPDHANNIKKATRYGCDACDKTTTKQRQAEPYLRTIKVPKNNFTFKFSPKCLPSVNRSLTQSS